MPAGEDFSGGPVHQMKRGKGELNTLAHMVFHKSRRRQCLKRYLLLTLAFTCPAVALSQTGNRLAPEVKVLATLESDVYAWSPNGQRLAYVAKGGIWVVEAPDFRQPQLLIRKGRGGGGVYPAPQLLWSPDGQKLAFADSRPGDGWSTIWVADADGSHVRDLLPPGAPFGSPGVRAVGISTWLSNQEIAFIEHCGTGCVAVYKVEMERGTYWSLGDLTVDGGLYWAPTKRWAIAEMHLGGLGVVEGSRFEPVSSSASSSPQEPYRSVLERCMNVGGHWEGEQFRLDGWSPDGKQALSTGWACLKQPATESGVALYLWDIESGRQEKLLSNAGWAAWSPDGSKVAFLLLGEPRYDSSQRIIGTDFVTNKPFRAYLGIMEVATKTVPVLVSLGPEPLDPKKVGGEWFQERLGHPLWSPDGKQLAARDAQGDLFLIRADGKARRPITKGMEVEAAWSPAGKRLALWPLARRAREIGESQGLERFLPPVGKEDAALPDSEIIEHYFQQILALGPTALNTYPSFLLEYAKALEEMGKEEAAEEQYRKGIELVRSEEQWQGTGMEAELENAYAAFLRRQKRQQEATAVESGSASHRRRELMLRSRATGPRQPWGGAPETPPPAEAPAISQGQGMFYLDEYGRLHRAGPLPVPQTLPPLYIVEVPEGGNSTDAHIR